MQEPLIGIEAARRSIVDTFRAEARGLKLPMLLLPFVKRTDEIAQETAVKAALAALGAALNEPHLGKLAGAVVDTQPGWRALVRAQLVVLAGHGGASHTTDPGEGLPEHWQGARNKAVRG